MFSIEYNEARGYLCLRSHGFFTVEEAMEYTKQAKVAGDQCLRDWGDIKLLIVSDGQVQSASVIEQSKKLFSSSRDLAQTRIAMVLPSSLLKMQVGRVIDLPHAECFVSESAAIAWLLAEYQERRVTDTAQCRRDGSGVDLETARTVDHRPYPVRPKLRDGRHSGE